MSQGGLPETGITPEERYAMLRKSLAHYLLLQVSTFIHGAGQRAVGPAMEILTQKSAELKVAKINKEGLDTPEQGVLGLSQNLAESMGDTFRSDYRVDGGASSKTVTLRKCGCIRSVVEVAEDYGLGSAQARAIFCGACIGGYKKAARLLDVEFEGRLSEEGCAMTFSTGRGLDRPRIP